METLTRPQIPACPACGALLSPRLSESDLSDGTLFGEQTGWFCRECGLLCDLSGQELG